MTTKAGDGHLQPPKVPAVQGETRPAPQGAGAGAGAGALTGPSAPASCLRSGLCLLSSREEPAGQSVPPMPRCPQPCNDGCPPSPTVSAQPEVRAKSPHPRSGPGKRWTRNVPGSRGSALSPASCAGPRASGWRRFPERGTVSSFTMNSVPPPHTHTHSCTQSDGLACGGELQALAGAEPPLPSHTQGAALLGPSRQCPGAFAPPPPSVASLFPVALGAPHPRSVHPALDLSHTASVQAPSQPR